MSHFVGASEKFLDGVGRSNAEVCVLLVDDAHIRTLNHAWRGKDTATDVLSWPHHDNPAPTDIFLGDIAISLDTNRAQAARRGWDEGDEASLLLLHGVLHLLGHEDETESGAARMQAVETRILGKPLDVLPDTGAA